LLLIQWLTSNETQQRVADQKAQQQAWLAEQLAIRQAEEDQRRADEAYVNYTLCYLDVHSPMLSSLLFDHTERMHRHNEL
jgi:hypothetical protein